MKNRIEIADQTWPSAGTPTVDAVFVTEMPRGKRGRRQRDAEPQAPKAEAPRKWTEREGYFQGAKVSRR